jgi:hypothetical protein
MADRESVLRWMGEKKYRVVDDRHPSRRIVEMLINEGRAEWLCAANRVRATGMVRVGGPGDTGCYSRNGKACEGYVGSGCRHCGRLIGTKSPAVLAFPVLTSEQLAEARRRATARTEPYRGHSRMLRS